jgi:CBS domain-containing protein
VLRGRFEALRAMSRARTRRIPIVGDDGGLVGILALDDVLELVAEETAVIGRLLERRPTPSRVG